MVRGVLCLVMLAACGRLGFDPVAGAGDDVSEDEGPSVFTQLALPSGGDAWSIATTTDRDLVYVVVSGRVFRSDNRGVQWTDCGRKQFAGIVLASPTDDNIVYLGDEVGLYRSLDGCATWELLATTPEISALVWNGTDLMIGADGLWRYDGSTLMKIASPADDLYIEYIAVQGPIVIVTTWEAGVFRSLDSGRTFSAANMGRPQLPASGISFPDPTD